MNSVVLFCTIPLVNNFLAFYLEFDYFISIFAVDMNGRGKLYFKYGTMGSAKTALLLTQAYNFEERGLKYLCMKPIIDNREKENVIRSRIGIERECSWIYQEMNIYEYVTELYESSLVVKDWILIDESQFLTEEQIDQLARIVDDYGTNVVCYGLRTDFQSHLFEGSRRLFEIADSIEEIKSTCACGRKTSINARIDAQGNIVTDGNQVEIGGDDRYVALCRSCWRNKRIESAERNSLKFKSE
ncbi:MAG: thymidine kinase [Muribaculaceae bacterium]|nr:thymidine kinase [Muribaculaceae bacterium]